MAHLKTAISIQESLFQEAEALAAKMKVSRSQLFAMAIAEFIQKRQNRYLLDQLNAAYDDMPDASEAEQLQVMKTKQRQLLEEQW